MSRLQDKYAQTLKALVSTADAGIPQGLQNYDMATKFAKKDRTLPARPFESDEPAQDDSEDGELLDQRLRGDEELASQMSGLSDTDFP